MKRLLTLHIDNTRLTPEVVEVLRVVGEQYAKPTMMLRSDGLAIYVPDWKGLI